MITFKSNKDNNEYLMIDARYSMLTLGQSQKLTGEVLDEANKIFSKLYKFEKENNHIIISEVAIRKDSAIGQYLLKHSNQDDIINEDLFIYYENIVNALNIAIYESCAIAERIIPLFRRKVHGSKEELLKEYDEVVLDYILTHDDFHEWIEPQEKDPTEYIVFEDGEYSKKTLLTNNKVLDKKRKVKTQ